MEPFPPSGNTMVKDVQVASRIGAILDALSVRESASLVDLSAASGLPVSTTSRLLATLEREAFVERDHFTKKYYLGRRLLSFAASAKPRKDVASVLHPTLEQLSRETGEDAGLAELHGEHAIFIDRVDGCHALRIIDVINRPEPLYCGAFRKLLLAFQPDAWIENYINKTKFVAFTSSTIKTPVSLWKEIESIRRNGFATSFSERVADAAGVAAPAFDHPERVRAAMQIAGPITRVNPTTVERFIDAAKKAGATATQILTGRRAEMLVRTEANDQNGAKDGETRRSHAKGGYLLVPRPRKISE